MRQLRRFIVFALLLLMSVSLQADPLNQLSFESVWGQVTGNSQAIKAAGHEVNAAEEARSRSRKHWLPQVYVDAKNYTTNDPGASFFGKIQQRAVTVTDFTPQAINQPGTSNFTRAALGLNMPLYEGGAKSKQVDLQEEFLRSKEKSLSATRNHQYSLAASAYGSIGVLNQQKEMISRIAKDIKILISSYKVGSKSNPVGYSGLLGLKSIANRIEGIQQQYIGQIQGHYSMLHALGLKNKGEWTPQFSSLEAFIQRALMGTHLGDSAHIDTLRAQVKVAERMADMEKARYRPQIGIFAEGYAFDGNRDTSDGYAAGVYLKWNLFDPNSVGRQAEASLRASAAEAQASAMASSEQAQREGLGAAISTLKENLHLIEKSKKLLDEQTSVARKLFRNGSINALQLTEVFNRKVDLISAETQASLELLNRSTDKILRENFVIPVKVEGR